MDEDRTLALTEMLIGTADTQGLILAMLIRSDVLNKQLVLGYLEAALRTGEAKPMSEDRILPLKTLLAHIKAMTPH